MPGYLTRQDAVPVAGEADLQIRSLFDRQQHADPRGEAARLGISSAQWSLFGQLWPSGAHLADAMAHRPVQACERILEIGCGLGLASLVGHRRGADVTASDIHPLAGEFLRENLRLNGLSAMKYRHAPWASPAQGGTAGDASDADERAAAGAAVGPDEDGAAGRDLRLSGRFDLIIGSDVLYERDEGGVLAAFIERHAAAAVEVWIVDPDRGNRAAFNRQMDARGFRREERRLDHAARPGPPAVAAYKGRLLTYRREAAAGPAVG